MVPGSETHHLLRVEWEPSFGEGFHDHSILKLQYNSIPPPYKFTSNSPTPSRSSIGIALYLETTD